MADTSLTMPNRRGHPLSHAETSATIPTERSDKPERIKSPRQLLDLPTELLWQILELIVVKPRILGNDESTIDLLDLYGFCHTCNYRHSRKDYARCSSLLRPWPGVLRTCRLFRHEGLHLFYSKNIFRSPSADRKLFQALNVIGREQAFKMRILIEVNIIERYSHRFYPVYDEWMDQMIDLQRDACEITTSVVDDPWKVRILTRQDDQVVFFHEGFSHYEFLMTVGELSDSTTNWTAVADLNADYAEKEPSRTQYDPGFSVEEPIAKLMLL